MQVFPVLGSPMQPCFTPPRQHIGHGQFFGTPVHLSMSPFQVGGAVASPHHIALASAMAPSPNKVAQEPAERHFKYEVGGHMEKTTRHPRGRYTIVRGLGSGVYGRVLECTDEEGKVNVAIKAVRAEHLYREAARREIRALQKVGFHENICRMLRSFDFQGHICVVQELIRGGTVYDKLKESGGYNLHMTQGIAKQLLAGLTHIHRCDVLHTDIKTDNIMIDGHSADGMPKIKIVDLGSAILRTDPHPDMIGTKEYRAPEAVLQAGWSSPADVWALGCSIFEVFTGSRLFEFDHEITQLHMLEHVLAVRIPLDILRRGAQRRNKHNAHLLDPMHCALARPVAKEANKITSAKLLTHSVPDVALLSLLQQMLAVDPARRPSATALQAHSFFAQDFQAKLPESPKGYYESNGKTLLPSSSSEDLSVCSTMDCRASDKEVASTRDNSAAPPSESEPPSSTAAGSTIDVTDSWAHLQEDEMPVITLPGPTGKMVEGVRC